jgi:DNA polymerase-1
VKAYVADIETDNLLDKLTIIHSLVLRDLATGELVASCTDEDPTGHYDKIAYGLQLLAEADRVYFHNGIKFDYPALRKVYPQWSLDTSKLRDTLVIAQMRFAHIRESDFNLSKQGKFPGKLAGSHALEAWGLRLGVHKGEYTTWCKENGIEDPWAQWRPEMQTYCEGDTDTGRALVLHIQKHGVSKESVWVEHELAWYLAQQERNGVPFDVDAAIDLQARLAARRETLSRELVTTVGPRYKRNGKPVTPARDNKKTGAVAGCPYQKLKLVDYNPASRADTISVLTRRFGWVPTEFTASGEAKLDDDVLETLNTDNPIVKLIQEYLLVEKRLGQISEGKEAWLRHTTETQPEGGKLTGRVHIHHRVKQNHAITHRASHSSPNLAQVPKVGSPFGEECRALFYVPDGWVMLGADASSLEARCLAHYMAKFDGGAYGNVLLTGDVHTANRISLGLPDGKEFRGGAKNWFYAFMYGAGDEKLGKMLAPYLKLVLTKDGLKQLGRKRKLQFLKNTPALKGLIDSVKVKALDKGYLISIDGRRVYVRSDHAALNTLLQCAGALLCKWWIANFNRRLVAEFGPQGWNGKWVALLWVHDEVQLAVRPEIAERVKAILVEEMQLLTAQFKWRVQLDGEAKTGQNWRDTH